MKLVTHYVHQNNKKQLIKKTNLQISSQTLQNVLQNKSAIAEKVEVFDLDLNRASRSAKHVRKYLFKKQLHPFEILVHKN